MDAVDKTTTSAGDAQKTSDVAESSGLRHDDSQRFDDALALAERTPATETKPLGRSADGVSYLLQSHESGAYRVGAYRGGQSSLQSDMGWVSVNPDRASGDLVASAYAGEEAGGATRMLTMLDAAETQARGTSSNQMSVEIHEAREAGESAALRDALASRGYGVKEIAPGKLALILELPEAGAPDEPDQAALDRAAVDGTVARCGGEIGGLDHEVAYAIDKRGEVVVRKEGTAGSVGFDEKDVDAMRGSEVMMHNHPSGCAFSGADVATAYQLDVHELRVSGPGGETYLLRPPEGMTFSESLSETPVLQDAAAQDRRVGTEPGEMGSATRERVEALWNNVDAERQTSLREAVTRKLMPKEAAAKQHYDGVMQETATRLGLRYERVN